MILSITASVSALFILIIILCFVFKKTILSFLSSFSEKTIAEAIKQTDQKSREILKEERVRILETVTDKLQLNEKSLEGKKDLILQAMENIGKHVTQSQDWLKQNDQNRVKEFENLRTIIQEQKDATHSLQLTTDNLKKILSNNQMRGNFGQQVAEDLLRMAGFVKGQNYLSQAQQETTGNKPDFTVLLPDDTKVNIDVKFPFQALQKYQETEDKQQQLQYLAAFKTDIKQKLKEITTRNYISPEENTVDFVVMFVPNEMIFSFIYDKYPDVWQEAIKSKVVMCGPFSFTAILRMVKQSYDNFKYQKNLHGIIQQIKVFEVEYKKFSTELDALGKRIESVAEQYSEVATTRDRALNRVIEKIKLEEGTMEQKERIVLLDNSNNN